MEVAIAQMHFEAWFTPCLKKNAATQMHIVKLQVQSQVQVKVLLKKNSNIFSKEGQQSVQTPPGGIL